MSQTELLAARLDAAVSDALQRVAMGITADISLSSSAWSVRMGLDRLQAALVRGHPVPETRAWQRDLQLAQRVVLLASMPGPCAALGRT